MSVLLKSGKVGNIQLHQLAEQRKKVVSAWEETGLLKGLDPMMKANMAQLMENQAGALLNEVDNVTSNVAGFDISVFPMLRRVFSRLLANEIVSVQPLNLPTGLVFYLDHQVETVTTGSRGTYSTVYDAHYNNAGYDYSRGTATTVGSSATTLAIVSSSAATLQYSGGEESLASLRVYGCSANTGYVVIGGETTYTIDPITWTQGLFHNNQIAVKISGSSQNGNIVHSAYTTWTTYADLEGSSNIAEVRLIVTSTTVNVGSRKMKAHWTQELAQDLAAYHSIDAEAELTALLSEELAAEIDREIIRDLINFAPYETSWSYDRSATVTRSDGVQIPGDPASGYVTQKEWNQTLITQINKISAHINKMTLRGGANFLVVSTEVGSVLEDLEKFHAVNDTETEQFNMGIEKAGTLTSRYTVYKDPYLPAEICLIGHKGKSFMDTGYVYAPYIPFTLTPTVLHPDDFTPRKGIMTRYAKKVVNNKYYGLVRVIFPTSYNIINYA